MIDMTYIMEFFHKKSKLFSTYCYSQILCKVLVLCKMESSDTHVHCRCI